MDIADIIAQQGEIARRRKLLGDLQTQAMQSPIQGSSRGASVGQALAKVATAYFANQGNQELSGQEAANRNAYSGALQQALSQHMDTREGKPGQTLSAAQASALLNNDQDVGANLAEPVKANPRRAAIEAMASQFPELQAIGKTEYGGLQKEQITPLDLLKLEGFDPRSKVAAALGAGVGALEGKHEYRDANGQIFMIGPDGKPQLAADARDKYGPTQSVNGEAVQFAEGTGKAHQVANRPPSTNVNVIPPAQKAGLEELFKKYAGTVADMGKAAYESVRLKSALEQLGSLSQDGTYTGPVANAAVWVNGLLNAAGLPVDAQKLANSENYNSVAAEAAQRLIGQFGGNRGVTKEEAEQIKSITPQLATSPVARAQLTQILSQAADRSITNYRTAHENFTRAAQANDATQINPLLYNSQMPTAEPTQPIPGAGGQKPSVSNW